MDDAVALLAFSVCAAIASGTETPVVDWQSVITPLAVNAGVLLAAYLLGRLLCVLLNGRSSDHPAGADVCVCIFHRGRLRRAGCIAPAGLHAAGRHVRQRARRQDALQAGQPG